ncbi:MAG: DUF4926 domain-containing protein [Anaerolineae bacterium]|nr:DUF4926 domain-containing protein [Anaerolineae bacterium]
MNADEVDPATIPLNGPLSRVLWFDGYDLAANRAGFLSKKQSARLQRQADEHVRYLRVAAVFGVIALLLVLLVLFGGQAALFFWIALLGSFVIAFVIYQVRRWERLQRDLNAGEAWATDGVVRTVVGRYYRLPPSFILRVGQLTFPVRERALLVFQDGGRYRVYYTPGARIVLAAEEVPGATGSGRKRKREVETSRFAELDRVALTVDLPEYDLAAGAVGTIVYVHRGGEGYEVEFLDAAGDTIALATVYPSQIRRLAV